MPRIKSKVELNRITHSVRASQAVMQYGVGAMVDFPDQTLVTSAPEYWGRISRIYDDRFAKALDVDWFGLPIEIAYSRFPEWYFCPKCRAFQPLKNWISEYKKKASSKMLEYDSEMISHIQCMKCKQDLVPTRIVTVCEHGHLNEFPWIKWTHIRSKRPICSSPALKFKTGASGTEGLEGLTIECSCGARTTLRDAFDKDIFETIDTEAGLYNLRCEGNHPFRHTNERCGCYPKTVQRGASSVYFPVVYSSLVIPPYANKLNKMIEESMAYEECVIKIEDEETWEEKQALIKKRFEKWAEKIANEVGARHSDVEKILADKWLTTIADKADVTSVRYRFDEYMALTGEISVPNSEQGDFSLKKMPVSEYGIPHVKGISLVDKIRVVNALVGFSRLTPAANCDSKGFVCAKMPDTRWYPAYEVRGEGIFIEFEQSEIDLWISSNPEVLQRAARLNLNYAESFIGQNNPREITPKFILLHTISHLLISQLSFECGYSIASLSERLYCSEETDGKQMAGILIYTASGDSEGTLGGLVRQGRQDALPRIFKKALQSAATCSNDPICITSRGQGRDSLNLAACHSCVLLPETCCEERNIFLDRAMIIGTFNNSRMGFWSENDNYNTLEDEICIDSSGYDEPIIIFSDADADACIKGISSRFAISESEANRVFEVLPKQEKKTQVVPSSLEPSSIYKLLVTIENKTYDIKLGKCALSAILFLLGIIPGIGVGVGAVQLVYDISSSIEKLEPIENALLDYIKCCHDNKCDVRLDGLYRLLEKPKGKYSREEIKKAIDTLVDKDYLKIRTDGCIAISKR